MLKIDMDVANEKISFGNYSTLALLLKYFYSSFDNIVSFLTKTTIFLAINAALLAYFSFLLYNISCDLNLLLAAFFVTFTVYGLNKLTDIEEDSINLPEADGFIEKNKYYIICAIIISYITALSLAFLQNPWAILIILFPFCIGVLYSVKISNFRLKDIIGIKNTVVALSWAVMEAFLPLMVSSKDFLQIMSIFYFVFLILFIHSVIFDIRDIEGDGMSGVKTIPVVFGRQKTKNLLLVLNSTLIPWLAFSY
ncbi:MAG: UbiA family prenyltransferase, partial [Methanophagales archaeon]|nr:UbiA family prenyltransferase [Methanophagales archaeon]